MKTCQTCRWVKEHKFPAPPHGGKPWSAWRCEYPLPPLPAVPLAVSKTEYWEWTEFSWDNPPFGVKPDWTGCPVWEAK